MDESQSDGEITRNASDGSPFRGGALRGAALRGGALRGAREWAGWLLVAAGAVLCVLGWYGVSGERYVEQQIPYLASSTIPGAALIVAGTLLVALRSPSPPEHRDLTHQRVERLYELLVEPSDAGSASDTLPGTAAGAGTGVQGWLAVPEGTRYHRPDCPLVTGKARAAPVDADTIRDRGLTPCPLCSPPAPGSGPSTRPGESAPPTG